MLDNLYTDLTRPIIEAKMQFENPYVTGPTGLGMWIAYASVFGGHDRAIEKLESCGATWVAPRAGQGKFRDPQWKPRDSKLFIAKYHDAGIKVFPWLYDFPNSLKEQIDMYKSLIDEGADGVIIDAEEPWEKIDDAEQRAEDYVRNIYQAIGEDAYIADAPWPYCNWHGKFPHRGFALGGVKARHIQLYWTEINNAGEKKNTENSAAHWSKFHALNPDCIVPVQPIGITYGNDLKGTTRKPPGKLTHDDLSNFVRNSKHKDAFSMYSLEQMDKDEARVIKAALALPANRPIYSFGD